MNKEELKIFNDRVDFIFNDFINSSDFSNILDKMIKDTENTILFMKNSFLNTGEVVRIKDFYIGYALCTVSFREKYSIEKYSRLECVLRYKLIQYYIDYLRSKNYTVYEYCGDYLYVCVSRKYRYEKYLRDFSYWRYKHYEQILLFKIFILFFITLGLVFTMPIYLKPLDEFFISYFGG